MRSWLEQRRAATRLAADQEGQALLLALGGSLAVIGGALALVAIAGAVTGKGRAQRAADLIAISAARSMRDDLPRLLAPPALPNGLPNPGHLEKPAYLAAARLAGLDAARANGVDPERVRIDFPDAASFAPLRARAVVVASLGEGRSAPEVEASAIAEAAAPAAGSRMPTMASGGGYSGPLVYRDGEGMRPDVAAAFDRMAAVAAQAGIALLVVSGFRSDAEQAALFAAHPDPRWVAPPGQSLHRCATELDLGPEAAYAWLAANAGRFGFLKRYSWVLRPVSKGPQSVVGSQISDSRTADVAGAQAGPSECSGSGPLGQRAAGPDQIRRSSRSQTSDPRPVEPALRHRLPGSSRAQTLRRSHACRRNWRIDALRDSACAPSRTL
jgi:D-alanyl-D-alanine carboxypeptidase